jgi:lysophospholipase L1-like esterase
VYLDENGSDLSRYVGGFEDGIDTPLGDMEIRVFGAEPFSVQTCDDGSYQVPTLDDGVYVVSPVDLQAACSRRNCPRRLPVALEEGAVKILTIGDSVPVEGDPVTFPARVADLMAGLAEIDQVNAAVSGTQSSDWLPDGSYFGEIRSELADTDVVVIVLGGNDVLNYVSTADLSDLGAAVAGAQATVDQVVVNVRAIATEVRSENADIDVVFCIYPDYSQATATPPWSDLSFLPPGVVSGLLARARDAVTPEDAFVIVDLLEITQDLPQPLDDYLADSLHFNDAGHDLYAHEVFRALGGVIVGESPLGNGETFENRHDFGFVE